MRLLMGAPGKNYALGPDRVQFLGGIMGYQESMIFVEDLAEAAGIIKAIKEFKDKEWFCVFGPERARKAHEEFLSKLNVLR